MLQRVCYRMMLLCKLLLLTSSFLKYNDLFSKQFEKTSQHHRADVIVHIDHQVVVGFTHKRPKQITKSEEAIVLIVYIGFKNLEPGYAGKKRSEAGAGHKCNGNIRIGRRKRT